MKREASLPIIKNKKKINVKKFERLAKKVRETFEQEKQYVREKVKSNENNSFSGFFPNA